MSRSAKLRRRSFLGGVAASAGLAVLPGAARGSSRRQPNFIIVMTDDLGFGDIGPYGNRLIPTPNLDRMAVEGVTLTDYYSPAVVCTPSRAGMLTGRHAIRSGMSQVLFPSSETGLPLSERTIAELLRPDYATALFGKWHLSSQGPSWPPTVHGFDRFFGIPFSHDMKPLSLFAAEAGSPNVRQMPVDFDFNGALGRFDPGSMKPASLTSQLQQQFYAEAERFVIENAERPFYIELWLSSPHLPEIPAEEFKGTTRAGPYGDMVAEIDSIIGRLRARLAELGIEQDTLVAVTSDNGPWYWGSSGGLRERKGNGVYDGGSRVPFIAVQPGKIPAGGRHDWLASGLDVLPTLCAMAGRPLPSGVELDGFDMTDVLTGRGPSPREELAIFTGQDVTAIRTQRWKYNRQRTYDVFGYDELYDVSVDPSESYNVRDRYPEVAADMAGRLDAAIERFAPFRHEVVSPAEMRAQ
ncbi:MAG TPA: sulfatase-like hydrolase/transferase [Croceibacterium sp.]|nr:sulfatase-like hydrolase/transferase [Croceibacterium sp.]